MNKRRSFARNRQGVKVLKCCASCQHKCVMPDGTRLCALVMDLIVEPDFKCHKYEMQKGLLNAGKGGGKVKRHEYLEFVRETRMQERMAIDKGLMKANEQQSANALRKQFEELYGKSVYVEIK